MADGSNALLDALKSSGQAQSAKFGTGGLLDMVLAGYQAAFPNAPAARLAMGARQAYNIGKYNKAVQAQADLAKDLQRKQNMNNAGYVTARTGYEFANPEAGFDTSLVNAGADDLRNDANMGGLRHYNETGDLDPNGFRFNTAGYQGMVNDVVKRSQDINDANQTLAMLGRPLGQDMGIGGIGQEPALQNADGSFNAGVQKAEMVNPMTTGRSAIPNIGNLLTFRSNEQDNTLANSKFKEDIRQFDKNFGLNSLKFSEDVRNHKANEGIGWYNAKTGRINANKPPSGSGNPYTIPNAQQSFLEGQAATILSQLKEGGYVDKDGKIKQPDLTTKPAGFLGLGGHTPSDADIEAGALIGQLNMIRKQIKGDAPFGGQAKQALQNSSSNLGAQYGVRY